MAKKSSKLPIFDSHHKMERFSLMFMAFVIALVFIAGICFKQYRDNQKLILTEQALYTHQAMFTLSQEEVTIHNVYRNNDFTKAFVLMQVTDVMNLNTDANKYWMYMTSGSDGKIKGSPTGAVYVFGNTGYIGLYFANAAGFDSQLYDITLRNTAKDPKSYEGYGVMNQDTMIDSSDCKYNQIHFRVNFGGTSGVKAKFLESDTISIIDAYNETVANSDYNTARETLNMALISMSEEINNLNEYTNRLKEYGMKVPALPNYIAGDYVTNDVTKTKDNPINFDKSMLNSGSNVIVDNYNVVLDIESEGSLEELIASDTLYYVTDFVYPGGVQFNFQDISLSDHALHDIIGDKTYSNFAKDKVLESDEHELITKFNSAEYYKTWYYNNGTVFKYDAGDIDVATKSIYEIIQKYQTSVSNLISAKQLYQTTYLMELLKIEASTESVSNVTSLNTGNSEKPALQVY